MAGPRQRIESHVSHHSRGESWPWGHVPVAEKKNRKLPQNAALPAHWLSRSPSWTNSLLGHWSTGVTGAFCALLCHQKCHDSKSVLITNTKKCLHNFGIIPEPANVATVPESQCSTRLQFCLCFWYHLEAQQIIHKQTINRINWWGVHPHKGPNVSVNRCRCAPQALTCKVCSAASREFEVGMWDQWDLYHLVMTNIAMERSTIFNR